MSGTDVLIVLQARMGSQRLPGKSLMTIAGQSLLAHCVTRLERSGAGPVMVATSTQVEDDVLAAEAASLGALLYRGSADDVLDRVNRGAALRDPRFVVRATADNPAVDPESVTRLLAIMRDEPFDHAVEQGLPCGATVEVMTRRALQAAAATATAPHDREHVTPFIRLAGNGFRCAVVPAPAALSRPDLRFTVDTWTDLEYMRTVFRHAGHSDKRQANLEQLIAAADRAVRADGEVA
jgi:spore coat polysaccharide biosynthesis protein SpsF